MDTHSILFCLYRKPSGNDFWILFARISSNPWMAPKQTSSSGEGERSHRFIPSLSQVRIQNSIFFPSLSYKGAPYLPINHCIARTCKVIKRAIQTPPCFNLKLMKLTISWTRGPIVLFITLSHPLTHLGLP